MEPMQYKTFTWPHNPRVYTIDFERQTVVQKVPMGEYTLQDLGRGCRVMRGEGEFYGPDAYDTFKELATVFCQGGPGVLIHPVWQTASALFTKLQLRQEPRRDYVAYSFAFREELNRPEGLVQVQPEKETMPDAVYHTVRAGETFWHIAARYDLSYEQLISLNPQLRNPNLLLAGERVRVA